MSRKKPYTAPTVSSLPTPPGDAASAALVLLAQASATRAEAELVDARAKAESTTADIKILEKRMELGNKLVLGLLPVLVPLIAGAVAKRSGSVDTQQAVTLGRIRSFMKSVDAAQLEKLIGIFTTAQMAELTDLFMLLSDPLEAEQPPPPSFAHGDKVVTTEGVTGVVSRIYPNCQAAIDAGHSGLKDRLRSNWWPWIDEPFYELTVTTSGSTTWAAVRPARDLKLQQQPTPDDGPSEPH